MTIIGQILIIGSIEGVSGWHVNAPRALAGGLAAYEVQPSSPEAVYAGDVQLADGTWRDTTFLRFADEAAGMATLQAAGLVGL